tara:strand:+ start:471 stop:1175 length:705 start_codon:yes stop_codon:yes gene_type:complete
MANFSMKQIPLDIVMSPGPSLDNYFIGSNRPVIDHLSLWLGKYPPRPLRSPIPIYLWGDAASGKTHLLKAIKKALEVQGERLGWIDVKTESFPEYDESWSVILLDDIHKFTTMQQQLAFNWFINAQTHQISVISSGAVPPADLTLRDDLKSRLGWGHIFQLHLLDDVQRRIVLKHEAEMRGVTLSEEVLDFILRRFSRDLGSLMELLKLIDGYALQTQRAISIPLIKSMMDKTE